LFHLIANSYAKIENLTRSATDCRKGKITDKIYDDRTQNIKVMKLHIIELKRIITEMEMPTIPEQEILREETFLSLPRPYGL